MPERKRKTDQKKPKSGNRKGSDAAASIRRIESMFLRCSGYSYRQIGERLGISYEQARKDVKRTMEENRNASKEESDELRELENERIDLLWARAFSKAMGQRKDEEGNVIPENPQASADKDRAMQRCIQLSRARCELNGINMPTQIAGGNLDVNVNIIPAQREMPKPKPKRKK